MFATEKEARQKMCLIPMNPRHGLHQCVASECMTYWRWSDPEHTEGYCAIAGKPEN